MGQAKQRGTFEKRRENALVLNEQARLDKLAADMEYENSLTPEERERRKAARLRAAQILAMAVGMMSNG